MAEFDGKMLACLAIPIYQFCTVKNNGLVLIKFGTQQKKIFFICNVKIFILQMRKKIRFSFYINVNYFTIQLAGE